MIHPPMSRPQRTQFQRTLPTQPKPLQPIEFYNSAFQLDNIVIPDCLNPKHPTNPPVSRKPHVQPGMSELVNIVAGLEKDAKKINACLTKQGAQEYIARNNKNGWYAWKGDITGPDGVPDSIPEVLVSDSKGNKSED